ncbi:MAG: nucleotidyltransferase family protein [Candidatus Doudnabacteria bacterium]|nr:nucleotidyltransferase family protein [Candidatus Doudnabacteria bacterium]
MQAVILAAGLGTRMGNLTSNRPKPLLTIENKSLLEHNFHALPNEINEVVLVVGYLGDQIKELIGTSYNGRKVIHIEQKELLGTGHALDLCKDVLRGRFLVLMGDDLYAKKDLVAMIKHPLSLLVLEVKGGELDMGTPGVVKLDESGRVFDIVEGERLQKGSLVNCAAYVLDERYFDLPMVRAENKTSEFGLPQTMLQMLKNGTRFDLVRASWWHKVTSPQDLQVFLKNEERS